MKSFYFKRFALCLFFIAGTAVWSFAQVAKVGDKEYATLADAVAAVPTDGTETTVTMLADVDNFGAISFSERNITLDLNGKTATGSGITVGQNATLTIVDKTATSEPVVDEGHNVKYDAGCLNVPSRLVDAVKVVSGGSVILKSGKIISGRMGLYAEGDKTGTEEVKSTVTLAGGYVEAQEFAISPQGKGATAKITGGVALARDNAVVAGNGTNKENEKRGGTYIDITGGTLIGNIQSAGYVACGIYHPQSGTLNISGGTIYADGGAGVVMRGGTLNITGGTIVASGDASLLGKVGDSKAVVGTSGIVFDRNVDYYDATNVSIGISGEPSISGTASAISVLNYGAGNVSDAISVEGGTFSSDISEFLDDNVVTTTNESGQTVVKSYVAQVGNSKYLTLAEAFDAVDDNGIISLIYDVDDFGSISFSGKNITFDLNGKTATGRSIIAGQNATLTIVDKTATSEPVVDEGHNVKYDAGCLQVSNAVNAAYGGSVILRSGKIISSYFGLCAEGDKTGTEEVKSTVTLAGGYVEAQEFAITTQGKGATAKITGGVALARDNAVVAGNGTYKENEKRGGTYIDITGGTLIGNIQSAGYVACGIYHPQSGTLNISGGTIYADGGAGVVMRGGTLNITGGTIVASGDASLLGKVGDSRVVVGTSGIVFDRDANYYDAPNVNIGISEEPSISGTASAISVLNSQNYNDVSDAVSVKGGTFSSDVTDYCVEGFAPIKGEDGTYTVATGDVFVANGESGEFVSLSGDTKVLDLDYSTITKLIVNGEFTDVTVNYKRNFSTTNWSDWFVPFDLKLTADILDKFSFAELWDTELVDGGTTIEYVVMKEGDVVSANTPYIIKANTAGEQTIKVENVTLKKTSGVQDEPVANCSTFKQMFKFYGVYERTTLLDKYGYFLDSAMESLRPVSNAVTTIRPLRFYMTIQNKSDDSYDYPNTSGESESQGVKLNVIGDSDETTGVKDVNVTGLHDDVNVYTLQGTFVGNSVKGLKKGVYIVNGKKRIIK